MAIKTAPVLVATVAAPSALSNFNVPALTRVSPPKALAPTKLSEPSPTLVKPPVLEAPSPLIARF